MNQSNTLNLLLWYWGRRGAPVAMVYDLAKSFRGLPQVAPFLSLSRQSELFRETEELGLQGCHVDTYGGALSALTATARMPLLRAQIGRFARAQSVDVALCVMRHLWGGAIFPAMRKAGTRVLLMLHDTTPHPGEAYPFWRQHLTWDLANTDGLVVLSDHVRTSVIRLFGYPPERIWSVPLVVAPIHAAAPKVRTLPKNRPIRILMFGRLLPYKGIGLLADAFRLVNQRHQLELRIIGQGHDPALERLAGHSNVFIDTRWIPEKEITEILDNADVIVTPYIEASQSGVIPMAYALGLPVVTTPVGGLAEQVKDGVTGLVATHLSPDALALALGKIIADPLLYERCSRGALIASRDTLNGPAIAAKLLEIARTLATLPPR